MTALLLGCGNKRSRNISPDGSKDWDSLVTVDIDWACKPDVVHDLEKLPLPFPDDSFSEIHAYEVLEHLGRQGDWRFFLGQFADFWRILKPGGYVCASVPFYASQWAWGDPGHTRVITPDSLVFLSQARYAAEVGKTAMTDYRHFYKADFDCPLSEVRNGSTFYFVLQAVKPSRI